VEQQKEVTALKRQQKQAEYQMHKMQVCVRERERKSHKIQMCERERGGARCSCVETREREWKMCVCERAGDGEGEGVPNA